MAAIVGRLLDPVAIRRVDAGHTDMLTVKLVHFAAALRYWRGHREAGGPLRGGAVRILCYHAVADLGSDPVLRSYGIPGEQFGGHLDILRAKGCTFLSMAEFLRWLDGHVSIPRRAVMITFDDAYVSVAERGVPELRSRRIPAAVFAVTARAENIWDQTIGAAPLALLDVDRLRCLASDGVAIGSHTTRHAKLSTLDESSLVDEIARSADELQHVVPKAPFTIAYPHGDYDDRVVAAVRGQGVCAGFTVDPGLCRRRQDRLRIPRIEILRDDDGWRFWFKVSTGDVIGRVTRNPRLYVSRLRRVSRIVASTGRRLGGEPAKGR